MVPKRLEWVTVKMLNDCPALDRTIDFQIDNLNLMISLFLFPHIDVNDTVSEANAVLFNSIMSSKKWEK